MPAAGGGGGGGSDPGAHSTSILWILAAIFGGLAVIWFSFKTQIIMIYFRIKLLEIDFLSLFNSSYFRPIRENILYSLSHEKSVSFQNMVAVGADIGSYIRYPFVLILFALAILVYFGNSVRMFKRNYSMTELATLEKDNWPQISPIVGLNLVKTDIDKGPWAMAASPMQFCKRHKLLEEVRQQRREGLSRKEWDKVEIILKKGEANKLFALQLGATWRGVDKLPPHIKALFAAFAARINADTQAAAKVLLQLSSSEPKNLNLSGVDELIKKHLNTKLVQECVNNHAYVFTVMASMLERAREDGVQASADFLWLKPFDRKLWYTLNTVGRQTPFSEVAGIFAHWVAEKEAGRKLLIPMVEEATKAMEIALKEMIYHPDAETQPS